MTISARAAAAALLVPLFLICVAGLAFRVGPSSFHLEQAPGTDETYTLVVTDDTDHAEEIRLYLGDWIRSPDGEHDWDIPLDGARFTLDRSFAAGETVRVLYTVALPGGRDLQVFGEFVAQDPRLTGTIGGPGTLGLTQATGGEAVQSASGISVTRTVEGVDAAGVVTVALQVRAQTAFSGIKLYERFSQHAEVTSPDSGGGTFDTVNRSCADWISLSSTRLSLVPGESKEVSLRIAAPTGISGMYWGVVFVESAPTAENRAGTQILSIYRTAVKVYVTVPGTAELSGLITSVQVTSTDPLTLSVGFDCTGNVQLAVSGVVDVIDQTGTTVRSLPIPEFYVLPGAHRDVLVSDFPGLSLTAGVYQAVARLDFGGENPVGGVRGFRVK